jgi:acyl carrier protein
MQLQNLYSQPKETENGTTTLQAAMEKWLVVKLAEQLSLDVNTVSTTEPVTRYGIDSIDAVTMVSDLEDLLGLELPATLLWDHPTIEKAAQHLAENFDISAILTENESN